MDSASQADDQTLLIKSGFYTLLYFRQSISNLRLLHFFFVSFPNIFFHLFFVIIIIILLYFPSSIFFCLLLLHVCYMLWLFWRLYFGFDALAERRASLRHGTWCQLTTAMIFFFLLAFLFSFSLLCCSAYVLHFFVHAYLTDRTH